MKKIVLLFACLFFLSSFVSAQTRWMRLHPDVSWKYLEQWEKKHQWLTPAREGRIHFQNHELGLARERLETAVAEGAEDGRLLYELGYCCQAQGDAAKALRHYLEAVDLLARLNPDHLYHFNAEYLIGVLYEDKGERERALDHYDRALKLRPETGPLRYRKAFVLHRLGRLDESLAEIERVLELTPDSGSANYLAGLLSLERGDLLAARKYLETAASHGVEEVSIDYCLGYISSRQGRYEAAIAYYEKAIRGDPAHREARIALANLAYEQDDLGRSREHFECLTQLEPSVARWHYNLGVVCRLLEMDEMAGRELDEARRLDPDLVFLTGRPPEGVPALFIRAAQMQAEENYSRAIALYREALAEDPFFLPSRYNLALAYSTGGERNKALRQYSRLLRIDPDYSPAHLNAGILAYQKKRRQDAAHHLRRYLILEPDSLQADLIKRYLRDLRGW